MIPAGVLEHSPFQPPALGIDEAKTGLAFNTPDHRQRTIERAAGDFEIRRIERHA